MLQSVLFLVALSTVAANIPNNTNIEIPPVALPRKSLNLLLGNDDGCKQTFKCCFNDLHSNIGASPITVILNDQMGLQHKHELILSHLSHLQGQKPIFEHAIRR